MNQLERAYRRSSYEAAGAVARVGRRSPALEAVLARLGGGGGARQGGFLGAWNPLSRRMPPSWNRRMQARLMQVARRLPAAAGWGGTACWQEAHCLFAADPRRLAVLARRFRQAAFVLVRRGQPARLCWVFPRLRR